MNRGERCAARHYRLRGYRILAANARAGGYELDLVVRRGRRLIFVEVKERQSDLFGGPVGAVDTEKRRRVGRAARAWLNAHREADELDVGFEICAVMHGKVERLAFVPE